MMFISFITLKTEKNFNRNLKNHMQFSQPITFLDMSQPHIIKVNHEIDIHEVTFTSVFFYKNVSK